MNIMTTLLLLDPSFPRPEHRVLHYFDTFLWSDFCFIAELSEKIEPGPVSPRLDILISLQQVLNPERDKRMFM